MDIKILPLKEFKEFWPDDAPPPAFYTFGTMYIINFSEGRTLLHLIHENIHDVLNRTIKFADIELHNGYDKACCMLPEEYFLC